MSTIYYYAKNESLPIFLKYGIRLSKNFDKEYNLNGYLKPYLVGLLNPRDDEKKYSSDDYTCLKLDVLDIHLNVIDGSIPLEENVVKEFKPIDKYFFGSYIKPRVLIDTSIISDKISVYNKFIDIPLLYNNSEEFYYQVQIEKIIDKYPPIDIYKCLKEKFE